MHYHENINSVSVIHRISPEPTQIQGTLAFDEITDRDRPLIEQVADYYAETLLSSARGLDFLHNRGICCDDAIRHFRLGFADRSLGLRLCGLSKEEEGSARGALQRVGLLKPSGHEFFRGALFFPFLDAARLVVGAYGRRVTPKLKAYSVYHVHWLTCESVFFNQEVLESSRSVILCKTPVEALTWWCAGFRHVISLMGSLSFGIPHMKTLKQRRVRELLIGFGASQAECLAARAIAIQVEKIGIQCRFIVYPQGMDANGFAQSVSDPSGALMDILEHSFVLDKFVPGKRFRGGR